MTLPNAAPKPQPRTEAERIATRIASVQKLRASQKPIKRSGRPSRSSGPPKKNARRRKSEFARAYGSVERVEFVRSLPCAACGIVGFSENAHLNGGGAGRKSHHTRIAPLCGPHYAANALVPGCHRDYDNGKQSFIAARSWLKLSQAATATELAWQKFSAARLGEEGT